MNLEDKSVEFIWNELKHRGNKKDSKYLTDHRRIIEHYQVVWDIIGIPEERGNAEYLKDSGQELYKNLPKKLTYEREREKERNWPTQIAQWTPIKITNYKVLRSMSCQNVECYR